MSTKKPCINCPSCTYTGKEQSPLRYGLSAEGYNINSVIEGYDKKLWVVENKNNKNVWVRKDETIYITHEEPVINSYENDVTSNDNVSNIKETVNTEKKATDYNIFLSYRLNQMKELNQGEKKNILAEVIAEWKIIKNKPDELMKILADAKKFALLKPAKSKVKKISKVNEKKLDKCDEITVEQDSEKEIINGEIDKQLDDKNCKMKKRTVKK